jgi:hypothetical protein
MARDGVDANVPGRKEDEMNAIWTIIVMAFVAGVLGVVAYALFELSPFAHHTDVYHRRGEHQASPRLD